MFLHLILTDFPDKFSDIWINEWERAEPGNNFYIKHRNCPDPRIRSGKTPVVASVDEFHKVISDFSNIEGVILSGHKNQQYLNDIIASIPRNVPICFFSWSGFRRPEYFEKTRRFRQKRLLIQRLSVLIRPDIFLRKFCSFFKRKSFLRKNADVMKDFYERIDIFASFTKKEFEDYLKRPGINPNVVYRYGTVGLPTSTKIELCRGNAIQIGNSANVLNNHCDLFDMVKPLVKQGTKIIVPLTYGGNPSYKKYVINEGRRLFGDDFVPLTEHLSYGEYQNLLTQSAFFVSGQTTITSIGNLYLALQRGAKAFVPRICPMYEEYRNLGIPIFSLEDDLRGNPDAFTAFTEDEKLHCQSKFYENVNAERGLEGCRNILALLRKMYAERTNAQGSIK